MQPFPWEHDFCIPLLQKTFKDDGFEITIQARPMESWRLDDYRVKKGEKALFWLGNLPWWASSQVDFMEGSGYWEESQEQCSLQVEGGMSENPELEHEAGAALGGPVF